MRPQTSALFPTGGAIGSITNCAAIMQDDIIAVASPGKAAARFWPTSGGKAVSAKWNSADRLVAAADVRRPDAHLRIRRRGAAVGVQKQEL
ncbi:hypothetical protein [uncultured Rhodoblastus sp.]|uniref:hypothetical protein n=1 Tax=uncultured Rhodoblastus sp. TaxID=543037 RepID=UPI0025F32589|nr:hypothetical protein [uncultured Rhodoblastus sp.]